MKSFEETSIEGEVAQLHKHGYVIIPSLLSSNLIETLKSALAPFLRGTLLGRNNFEGFRTERVYALLASGRRVGRAPSCAGTPRPALDSQLLALGEPRDPTLPWRDSSAASLR